MLNIVVETKTNELETINIKYVSSLVTFHGYAHNHNSIELG